ncbi:BglG family transcription antiterminator [Clostridium polynesiense]|uniref:BglG family transcription antiterminator n=1 Tax=Clostridium polynesiense TaxID=1325933 RepID=UPI00058D4719|nr:BglG family transcription antiterminator [Clostridium polynesiense]
MNKKVYELLLFLISHKDSTFHLSELGDLFNVNVRTIRNYISIIEDFLLDNSLQNILLKNGSKVSFIGGSSEVNEILKSATMSDFYDYRLSSEERQTIISIMLLLADKPITISDFEDTLFASRSTVKKDIALTSNLLNKYGVVFSESKRKGYTLSINESIRRNVLYYFIKEKNRTNRISLNNSSGNICLSFIKNQINYDFYHSRVENALCILEHHFHLEMTDVDFNEILILICITCYRLDKRKHIEETYAIDNPPDNFFCEIAEYALKLIIGDSNFTTSDILYIADKLSYKITYTDNTPANQELLNYYIIVKGFLHNLSYDYDVSIHKDYKLQEFLTAHIARVFHRIKEGDTLINPYKAQLLTAYPEDYNILKNNIYYLEENLNIKINEDEISYILMHIEASLEKIRQNLITPNVIIVCHAGFGTSHFLAEKLSKHFKIHILEIISTHKLKEYAEKERLNCDFIISTIPLVGISTPWIQVNPILSEEDLVHVNRVISDTFDKFKTDTSFESKEVSNQSMVNRFTLGNNESINMPIHQYGDTQFSSLLSEEVIILDKKVENWKEAIILSGEPLLWNDVITSNYLRAVVNNVLDRGPYFVFTPGIALAHAAPQDGAKQLGASFIRLKSPVEFGHKTNDPITIVIMLSVTDTKKNLNMLFTTMDTLCNPEAVERLIKAKTKKEIIDIFRFYENDSLRVKNN